MFFCILFLGDDYNKRKKKRKRETMESVLVVLRGNSGSGKTTIAKSLQEKLGARTMLISQDVIRREILKVRDTENNPSVELIRQMAEYGKTVSPVVIIEGILVNRRYQSMLFSLIESFQGNALVYYFDLSFSETVKRHKTKPNKEEFGEEQLQKWWNEKDFLGVTNEVLLTDHQKKENIIKQILGDLAVYTKIND
ncbi:kinase [Enterococcus sp. JM9B]|uniref:kinase n=1 Tax=Enterococcus sp. JM9B TaxID=1857216 RepID=UPI002351AA54|nr:kinase [Enterococcus sp. JM9B]